MSTIEDVARAAGVSLSTVSYALSGKRPVSAATKERIDRAIRELDYHPNAGARALASAKANVIALVAPFRPGINMAVIMEFVGGALTAAREHDHDVLLATQDDPAGIARIAKTASADAFVVMDIEVDDPRIATLQRAKQPTALIGVPDDPGGLSCVDLDFRAAGRLAARHLIDKGHRTVGLIGAPRDRVEQGAGYAIRTLDGATAAARAAGIEFGFEPSEPSFAGGEEAAVRLLDARPGTTGIIVHNEVALAGALNALDARGLLVPDDVSVITIALPSAIAGLARSVTRIEVPGFEIGRLAVGLAMAQLADPSCSAETRLIAPRITESGSTAPPPR